MGVIGYIDYFIIFSLIILFYRFIRKTEAMKIIVGIFIIFLLSLLASKIGLTSTAKILQYASEMLVVGVVFIFHPELRMTLRKIGGITDIKVKEEDSLVSNIQEAVFSLAKQKIGALIIFDTNKTLSYQAQDLTEIDAKCTKELLETIFFPNTSLHDGAVIIQDERIAYAGCKLPLSGKRREGLGHLGTRHLAAIENAEQFDLMAIVVSEETGNISIVTKSGIYRIKSAEMFKSFFEEEDTYKRWHGLFKKRAEKKIKK